MIGKYIRVTGKRYKGTLYDNCICEVTDFIPNADIVTTKLVKVLAKEVEVYTPDENAKKGRILQFNYTDIYVMTDKEAVLEAL